MVRLVFRPYTQVKRTICTSVSLRASTRVSPGFALLRHSSPSFGSQQICSYSNLSQANDRSVVQQNDQSAASSHLGPERAGPSLSLRIGVLDTLILAYMLDSLVRVSRRVNENRIVSIASTQAPSTGWHAAGHTQKFLLRAPRTRCPHNGAECALLIPRSSTAGRAGPEQDADLLPRQKPMLTPTTSEQTPLCRAPWRSGPNGFQCLPLNNFKYYSLSFQSSFHLSLTVLVRYRSIAHI